MLILEIDGVDIVPFIAYGGVKWQRSDIDGPGAGRDLTGFLRRNRISTKIRLDVTCRPLTNEELKNVLTLLMPEWVTVRYYDPQQGAVVSKQMYANNNPASYQIQRKNGTEIWSGVTFPLIEK